MREKARCIQLSLIVADWQAYINGAKPADVLRILIILFRSLYRSFIFAQMDLYVGIHNIMFNGGLKGRLQRIDHLLTIDSITCNLNS